MKDTKFIVKKIRASAQHPNIWNSSYLTYVIRGNLNRINRAGYLPGSLWLCVYISVVPGESWPDSTWMLHRLTPFSHVPGRYSHHYSFSHFCQEAASWNWFTGK